MNLGNRLGLRSLTVGAICISAILPLPAGDATEGLSDEEIAERYRAITPKDEDFRYEPPPGWGANLALGAGVVSVTPRQELAPASRIVDGVPASTWTVRSEGSAPEVLLDLGRTRTFDRVVVYNRQTDQRGTAGGNNALRRFELRISENGEGFLSVGDFEIHGPRAVCFKRKGGGQVCAFIDSTEPDVIELPETTARFVMLVLREAQWGETALDAWKTSIAVSEILLFDTDRANP